MTIHEYKNDTLYKANELVKYKDIIYRVLQDVENEEPDNSNKFYPEQFFLTPAPFILNSSHHVFIANSEYDLFIEGMYFTPDTEIILDPSITIQETKLSRNGIQIKFKTSDTLVSKTNMIFKNGGLSSYGETITYEITDKLLGNGPAGVFVTDFEYGKTVTGDEVFGTNWKIEVFGKCTKDGYFKTSNSGTPSNDTGPGGASSYYQFVEASNPNNGNGNYGQAETSYFNDLYKIEFDYNMYGADIKGLYIEGYDTTQWVLLDSLEGQQQSSQSSSFKHRAIDIPHSYKKIRFRWGPSKGYRGDIAIDNIKIYSN